MKTINSILKEKKIESTWRGSEKTADSIRDQIRDRFGEKVAKTYDPKKHVLTLRQWSRYGIRVNKGESALKTFTIIESDNEKAGEQKRIRRSVPVFHYLQTDLITNHG